MTNKQRKQRKAWMETFMCSLFVITGFLAFVALGFGVIAAQAAC